jgi:hypothetical protein
MSLALHARHPRSGPLPEALLKIALVSGGSVLAMTCEANHARMAREWADPMISATCHTADNVRCLEFDATPWFSEADASSIVDLAERGWASPAIADSLEHRRGYERLHALVAYAAERLQLESLEDPSWETFECAVDGPEALAWLEKNRPEVVARIPSQSRHQR